MIPTDSWVAAGLFAAFGSVVLVCVLTVPGILRVWWDALTRNDTSRWAK